jgi:hypothetical protein
MSDSLVYDIVTGKNTLKKDLANISDMATGLVAPLTKMASAAAAAAAAIGSVVLYKSIASATEYEDVVNSLNRALASTGQFSKEASDSFREYANSLQETTKYSDDQVLSTAAMIQNLGRLTVDALKPATKAALDLSAALGIDLDSAASLVGKAANGNVAALQRYGIEVRKGTTDTETFANTLKTLETRFGGASEAAAKTFSGSTAKLKNSFDDIFKEIGRAFTKSPALIAAFNYISENFSKVAEFVRKSIGNKDIFKDLIINFSIVMQASFETARRIGLDFELAFLRAQQAWAAFKVLTTMGFSDVYKQQLVDINIEIEKTMLKFSQPSAATTFFDGLILKLSETKGKLLEFTEGVKNVPGAIAPALTEFALMIDNLAKSIIQKLAMGISQGVQSVVIALKAGKNAFSAFGSAILTMLGDMIIMIGETMILSGIGMEAIRASIVGLTGGPAIMMGVALVAFGMLLKSFGGGGASVGVGGGAGGGGGGGGYAGGSADMTEDEVTKLEPRKPETNIVVQVQGNILDRRQTGLEIAEVIQETFGTNGINYTTA